MYSSTSLLIFGILSILILTGIVIVILNIIKIKRSNTTWKKRSKENGIENLSAIQMEN
ncbi:MAG TPA: hypothetical protein VMY77_13250 [Chitinophagaceae bacterium]|nr:hypothetical protein [Chitinophagaceae bacterium]